MLFFILSSKVCKQLETIHSPFETYPTTGSLKRAMGVNQHHDAVTGTEKQHVAYDYAKRLAIAEHECQVIPVYQYLHWEMCVYMGLPIYHKSCIKPPAGHFLTYSVVAQLPHQPYDFPHHWRAKCYFTPKCLGLCGALSKERYNDRTKIPGFF